jgi:hypothetical protein
MLPGIISLLGVWPDTDLINSEKSKTKLNYPHYTELITSNLNSDFEIQ